VGRSFRGRHKSRSNAAAFNHLQPSDLAGQRTKIEITDQTVVADSGDHRLRSGLKILPTRSFCLAPIGTTQDTEAGVARMGWRLLDRRASSTYDPVTRTHHSGYLAAPHGLGREGITVELSDAWIEEGRQISFARWRG
jgi:hypothetical protein